ncbi:DUF3262 family protein [Aliikangiella maris]|uniref:DUF3262 family protein n=2 Tax=Aliikangiella maris TaxID=3162458 RepID=A0ABV2BYF7_9GAMM
MSTAEQIAAFLAGSGISMSDLKILFASILMSLTFIFVMIMMRGNHRSWSGGYIDLAEYASRTIGLVFILLIITYLVN